MKTRLLLLTALLTLGVAGTSGARDRRHDHDNNPPGRAGGAGTNWENPPGWRAAQARPRTGASGATGDR